MWGKSEGAKGDVGHRNMPGNCVMESKADIGIRQVIFHHDFRDYGRFLTWNNINFVPSWVVGIPWRRS